MEQVKFLAPPLSLGLRYHWVILCVCAPSGPEYLVLWGSLVALWMAAQQASQLPRSLASSFS